MWVDHDMASNTDDREYSYNYDNISKVNELKVAEDAILYDSHML